MATLYFIDFKVGKKQMKARLVAKSNWSAQAAIKEKYPSATNISTISTMSVHEASGFPSVVSEVKGRVRRAASTTKRPKKSRSSSVGRIRR